jgi:threonine dehydratase
MISSDNIRAAAEAIDPVFRHTPQYRSEALSARLGVSLLCKIESANPIGSFKGRGADWWFTRHAGLSRVVSASAGNFGQAIAYVGRRAGVAVEVFAAETANPAKVQAMQRLGAQVHQQGRDFDAAKEEAAQFAKAHGYQFVEDGREDEIAEGAGTLALELGAYPNAVDIIYVPLGNGALLNGVGSWFKSQSSHTKVVGVCAEGAPAMAQSWRQGQAISTHTADTIADGIAVRTPIPESLLHLRSAVDDIVLVSEAQILRAMRAYLECERLVTEPAGAVSLAAAMDHAQDDRGKTVATLVCGSNIDPRHRDAWLGMTGPPDAA